MEIVKEVYFLHEGKYEFNGKHFKFFSWQKQLFLDPETSFKEEEKPILYAQMRSIKKELYDKYCKTDDEIADDLILKMMDTLNKEKIKSFVEPWDMHPYPNKVIDKNGIKFVHFCCAQTEPPVFIYSVEVKIEV